MRRIHLPDESEDGWSFDPGSIEQVIEAHLRRQENTERHVRRLAAADSSIPSPKRRMLGLTELELGTIRQEAMTNFFEGATLSETLRQERQRYREHFTERVESYRKNPESDFSHGARGRAVLFAVACSKAVERATGEFSDMLTQAVVARSGRKDFPLGLRTELWKECLQFAMNLAQWENAGFWIDLAWGHDPHERPVPHLELESIREQQAATKTFSDKFRPEFENRMRHGSPQWLDEAERKISLRLLLSSVTRRPTRLVDPSKQAVAFLLVRNSELTTQQVCAKLDAANERKPNNPVALVPAAWQRRGVHSWIGAYEEFPRRVKTFVSKVRREAGISSGSHGRKLPRLPIVRT